MVTIWFEPHSTSLDNEAHKASGWNDVDLSEVGLQQSKELVERLKNRSIDAIFSSDLQRAVKTAIPAANSLHLPIYPDQRLRECDYGDFTQKDSEVVAVEKPKRVELAFPDGESYQDCMVRMKSFLESLKTNFDGKTVLIIGHRATQYGLDYWVNGKSVEQSLAENWTWQPGWKYELKELYATGN